MPSSYFELCWISFCLFSILALVLLTIGSQTRKAGYTIPFDTLRSE